MCVICIKPAGKPLPSREVFEAMRECNPDGFGYVSTKHRFKTLDFDKFMDSISQVEDDEKCLIHFRKATTGSVSRDNCHPFRHEDFFFAHNGTVGEGDEEVSDSRILFEGSIIPLLGQFGTPDFNEAVSGLCVNNSKFAIMDRKDNVISMVGKFYKYNDCLFSNLYFKRQLTRETNVNYI